VISVVVTSEFDNSLEFSDRIAANERKLQELYAKQGRKKQFRTKKERDEWIRKELEEVTKAKEAKQKQVRQMIDSTFGIFFSYFVHLFYRLKHWKKKSKEQ
jgi:predicted Holliday junction resolvase-like endonuclease